MTREELLSRLAIAERQVNIFLNVHKEPRYLNRLKKFITHPYKFLYLNAYKRGLHHKNDYTMKLFWGDTIILPLADENNVTVFYTGSLSQSECRLARYFIQTLSAEDIFYDVGANFGFFGFLAHALGVKEVHVFEPSDVVMRYVRRNAAEDIVLNEVAVADKDGEMEFFDLSESNKGQMSSLFADYIPEHNRKTQRVYRVASVSLDSYISSHTPPSVIKMDIENSESLALTGALELLRKHSPILVMECMDTPRHIERTRKALEILSHEGYRAQRIEEDGSLTQEDFSTLGSFGEFNERVFIKAQS